MNDELGKKQSWSLVKVLSSFGLKRLRETSVR